MSSFYLTSPADLAHEIDRLGLAIPVASDAGGLLEPFRVGTHKLSNRLCALPLVGDDADPDGSPSEYTVRRYQRYAHGGFGIIWFEATELDTGTPHPGRLRLHDGAVEAFARCLDALREISPDALLVLQLWRSPGGPDSNAGIRDAYIAAAERAARAGFDGVDIACCHGNLLSSRLADPAGGALEDRARLLRQIVQGIQSACPNLLAAVRLDAYQARENGFGVGAGDYRRMDPAEPAALARMLRKDGVDLVSITAGSPNLFGDPARRAHEPIPDGAAPHEHPLTVLARHQDIGRLIRTEAPGLAVVGGGYSWLRQLAPIAAAAAVQNGAADIIGFGRLGLLLDPTGVRRPPGICSLLAFAEADLWEVGGPFGRRPAHDAGYRNERLAVFDDVRGLRSDSAFAVVFQQGRLEAAYHILRQSNPLPEMMSHIRSDAWRQDKSTLPQLQYMIAWTARRLGLTGVRVPNAATGKRVAIIGGGPTGLTAAVRLLEAGHTVALFEREDRLGGAPALVYPEVRLPDPAAEIDALLAPALQAGRLAVTLGREASPQALMESHDAVLVATGCWNEPSLGTADGVWPALRFLRAARRGECTRVPPRVTILCGGDAAMDAAVTARTLGAERLELVFDCPRQNAHWHLPDTWFDTPGVQARFDTHPVGYHLNASGAVHGLLTEGNQTLDADMVIEAIGLVAEPVDTASAGIFTSGALVNGGASVAQCMHEGNQAAEVIERFIRRGSP